MLGINVTKLASLQNLHAHWTIPLFHNIYSLQLYYTKNFFVCQILFKLDNLIPHILYYVNKNILVNIFFHYMDYLVLHILLKQ